ncbi:MAG: DNA translocase FtsK 4TM domain-containing protein, partial [Bacteroidota bacterium]
MAETLRPSTPADKAQRRRQILAFVGMLLSFMILLSLISYTSADQANGDVALWKIFTNDADASAKAERTQNWLGLLGAVVSSWLINATVGYAIVVLPILLMIWFWAYLREKDLQKLFSPTSYTLAFALLFASLNGTIRLFGEAPIIPVEWSGLVGEFLAGTLSKLVGRAGTVLLLLGALVATAAFAFDVDLQHLYERVRVWTRTVLEWMDEKRAASDYQSEAKRDTAVEIKNPEAEAAPITRPQSRTSPVPKENDLETVSSTGVPDGRETQIPTVEDLDLDIKAPLREEEVNFDEREQLVDELAPPGEEEIDYVPPSVDLLDAARTSEHVDEMELKGNAELLRAKLADFGVAIESVSVTPGPVVTLYEL